MLLESGEHFPRKYASHSKSNRSSRVRRRVARCGSRGNASFHGSFAAPLGKHGSCVNARVFRLLGPLFLSSIQSGLCADKRDRTRARCTGFRAAFDADFLHTGRNRKRSSNGCVETSSNESTATRFRRIFPYRRSYASGEKFTRMARDGNESATFFRTERRTIVRFFDTCKHRSTTHGGHRGDVRLVAGAGTRRLNDIRWCLCLSRRGIRVKRKYAEREAWSLDTS